MFLNGFSAIFIDRLTLRKIVFIGLCHLRTFFVTYKQFIIVLWSDLFY